MSMSQLFRKRCIFIAAPGHKGAEEVFVNIVKPQAEGNGYDVEKGEHISFPHDNYRNVIQKLIDYDLVIFDISTANPNVCFEAGIRYMNARPVIFMAEERKISGRRYLPPDISHLDPIFYVPSPHNMFQEAAGLPFSFEVSPYSIDVGQEFHLNLIAGSKIKTASPIKINGSPWGVPKVGENAEIEIQSNSDPAAQSVKVIITPPKNDGEGSARSANYGHNETGINSSMNTLKEFMQRLSNIDKNIAGSRPILDVVNNGKISLGGVDLDIETIQKIERYFRARGKPNAFNNNQPPVEQGLVDKLMKNP